MEKDRHVLYHYGTDGMRWGERKYQYQDGSLTPAGKERYRKGKKKRHGYINYKSHNNHSNEKTKAVATGAAITIGAIGTKILMDSILKSGTSIVSARLTKFGNNLIDNPGKYANKIKTGASYVKNVLNGNIVGNKVIDQLGKSLDQINL
jgi:hypothetical protein